MLYDIASGTFGGGGGETTPACQPGAQDVSLRKAMIFLSHEGERVKIGVCEGLHLKKENVIETFHVESVEELS